MKIIIDATTTQDEYKSNGIGVYTRCLLNNLVKDFPRTSYTLLMYNGESTIDNLLSERNVTVVRVGNRLSKNFLNPMWYVRQLYPGLLVNRYAKKLTKGNDTLYFSPYFWNGLPMNTKMVVTIHDFALPVYKIYSQISPLHNLARGITYWIEILKAKFAKAIITDAEYTKQELPKYITGYDLNNVYPIHLASDLEKVDTDISKYLPEDAKDRGYIIYLGGGVTKNKNSVGVINSYYELTKMYGDPNKAPYLVIAGKNFLETFSQDAKELQKYVLDLGIKENVIYTGKYTNGERYSLFKNALASLHLSLLEGFGFSVVESMKSGCATVVHNGSCFPEIVRDGALLVNGLDFKEVASALYKLCNDRSFANGIIEKGLLVADSYNWKRTALKTHEVFEKVLGI